MSVVPFEVKWNECSAVKVTFNLIRHLGILYKLSSVGIGGSFLSVLTQFLSNRYLIE